MALHPHGVGESGELAPVNANYPGELVPGNPYEPVEMAFKPLR